MKKIVFSMAVALLVPSVLNAQTHHLEALIAPHVYAPHTIRQMQGRLNLSGEQEAAIRQLTLDFQAKSAEIEWDLERRMQALVPSITGARADVPGALAIFDDVLGMEANLKRSHFQLLIELKNLLNPQQQRVLREFVEAQMKKGEGSERGQVR
jgi:Spy/CpxP family protein refolding chaperone